MARDISSVRIARLNRLMLELERSPKIGRKALYEALNYDSDRTLERDIAYLRSQFGAHIQYDYSRRPKAAEPWITHRRRGSPSQKKRRTPSR